MIRILWFIVWCAGSALQADGLSDARQGLVALNRENLDSAIRLYTQAISRGELENSNLSITYNNRGVAWIGKAEVDRAISDFHRAISINPQYYGAYNNRGVAWNRKGELDLAISDFNQAIDIEPQYSKAYNNRGNAWKAKGELDLAIWDYHQAIDINSQGDTAYNNLAWLYATSRDSRYRDGTLAVKFAKVALNLSPDSAHIIDTGAAALARNGDYQQAVNYQEKVIRLLIERGDKRTKEFEERLILYQSGRAYVDTN